MAKQQQSQYNDGFIKALQWMWGDGYLSPGGPEEVATLLTGVNVSDKTVLDIGCGLGAIAVLLVETHGASHVTGIDVEPHLIDHCIERAKRQALSDKVAFSLVTPGPLPFADASFDIIFTKDAIIHIPDKASFYKDVFRTLKPGGLFVGSDWLRSGEGEYSPLAEAWLKIVHLSFEMKNLAETRHAIEQAGFKNVTMNDRNAWYREEIKNEMAALSEDKLKQLAKMIGVEAANHRYQSSALKQQVLEEGFLRPTHFIGCKPS